jgi:hypothetical protein
MMILALSTTTILPVGYSKRTFSDWKKWKNLQFLTEMSLLTSVYSARARVILMISKISGKMNFSIALCTLTNQNSILFPGF